MKKKELLDFLNKSIEQFYKHDKYLIEDSHKVHEQAIAHRIAHYFENLAKKENSSFYKEYHFDVEYNKNLENSKEIFTKCHECTKKCECKKYSEQKESRPDFLIHKRGQNDLNKFIVEFKTGSNNVDIEYDVYKLNYFTCQLGEYRYDLGCFVYIKERDYEIRIFQKGKIKKIYKTPLENRNVVV